MYLDSEIIMQQVLSDKGGKKPSSYARHQKKYQNKGLIAEILRKISTL